MITSAATILAEIDDTAPVERLRRIVTAPSPTPIKTGPKPARKPRTPVLVERAIDREADARAYRLAAIEHGVHPLLPRNLYGTKES
jgi:hypothetical protein